MGMQMLGTGQPVGGQMQMEGGIIMDQNSGMLINNGMLMNGGAPVMIMDGHHMMDAGGMMGNGGGYLVEAQQIGGMMEQHIMMDPNGGMIAPPPGLPLIDPSMGLMNGGDLQMNGGDLQMNGGDLQMSGGELQMNGELQINGGMNGAESFEEVDGAVTIGEDVGASEPPMQAVVDSPPPTYADAFPPLGAPKQGVAPVTAWGKKTAPAATAQKNAAPITRQIRSSKASKRLRVPFEQRRFKMRNPLEGERERQNDIIQKIIKSSAVDKIEINFNRDSSMDVMVNGKEECVNRAVRAIQDELMVQEMFKMTIPQEHHRYIIGPGGSELRALQDRTSTRVNVLRGEDTIEIRGLTDGIEKARHEIQVISDLQAKRAFERLAIPYKFHPFVCGPDNSTVQEIEAKTAARINIPPSSLMKDDITVAGDKEAVHAAVKMIQDIYAEKERVCQTVSVEVKKTQHRYVIGSRGKGLQEILAATGVSVEVPAFTDPTSSVILRGEPDKLGNALTLVYEKANSMTSSEVAAPKWLHRFLIGRKGENINKIKEGLEKLSLDFNEDRECVILEGPPMEVNQAQKLLETAIADLKSNMSFEDIEVDQKWHRHIIGKGGSNISRIKEATGTTINIPSDAAAGTDKACVIHIEGSPDGVQAAKEEILAMAIKFDGEKSRDITIEQRFHKNIIGQKGAGVRTIREKFADVQISFPNPNDKSDIVTLRGTKEEVDQCHDHLKKMAVDLVAANFRLQVPVLKRFHGNIIGKGGSIVTKIKEETGCTIDIPSGQSESNIIIVTGYKEKCEKARKMILKIESEMASVITKEMDVPQNLHTGMIGVGGKLIQSVMSECGDVHIHIPSKEEQSDKITIRGTPEDVEKAIAALNKLADERLEMSYSCEVTAKPEHHRFLIGRAGINIKQIRESTGARIMFPSAADENKDVITIAGKQEAVEKAKELLTNKIKELDNVIEGEVDVPVKHHRHFVLQRGQVCRDIGDEFGGVNISFPKEPESTRVVIKGAADCVENARLRILEIVEDLENFIEDKCSVPQKHHRAVLGKQGNHVRAITADLGVNIKFPERRDRPDNSNDSNEEVVTNGNGSLDNSDETDPEHVEAENPADLIIVSGKKENVELAIQRLLELVPVSKEVEVPFENHRYLIGQKGEGIRKLMDEHDVNINVPPAGNESNIITVTGVASRVEDAIISLLRRNESIEAENEDRKLKGFRITIEVPVEHHPKLIGRKGQMITELRDRFKVNINVPKPDEQSNQIVLQGYEENCLKAKEEILGMIKGIEDQCTLEVVIDPAVHARIIGAKGRSVKKIMDMFKVDIKMPRTSAGDPAAVVKISGSEEQCEECREHLKQLEDQYMEGEREFRESREETSSYVVNRTNEQSSASNKSSRQTAGFVVQDAPWSGPKQASSGGVSRTNTQAPPAPKQYMLDAESAQDFPTLGLTKAPTGAQGKSWGGAWRS